MYIERALVPPPLQAVIEQRRAILAGQPKWISWEEALAQVRRVPGRDLSPNLQALAKIISTIRDENEGLAMDEAIRQGYAAFYERYGHKPYWDGEFHSPRPKIERLCR